MRPVVCLRVVLVGLAFAVAGTVTAEPLPPGAIRCLGAAKFQQGGLVHGVAFSPDGKLLASAGEDAYVRLWDAATGKAVGESTRHYHGVQFLTYSRDGKRIATISHGAARILDGTTGKQLHLLKMPGLSDAYLGPIFAAAFSPDGNTIATGFNTKEIQLWDVATGKAGLRLKGSTERIGQMHFTPDGKALVTAGDDGTLRLWNPENGEVTQKLQGHKGRMFGLAISPDGTFLASTGEDGALLLWDRATGREQRLNQPGSGRLLGVTFSPDGTLLACASQTHVTLWDVGRRVQLRVMEGKPGNYFLSLAFSPDGKTLAGADVTSRIHQWDVATGKDRHPDDRPQGRLTALAFAPDGKSLLSAGEGEAPRLWDVAKGELLRSFGEPGKYRAIAFAADGKTVTAATAERRVTRWDTAGKEVQKLQRPIQGDSLVVLSPDARYLAWNDLVHQPERNDWKKFVGVWDVAQERELTQAPLSEHRLYALALSADGRMVLSSGSLDRTVIVHETLTGQPRARWNGPEAGLSAAVFSTDARIVALGGWDNQVWVRDLATGKNLHRLPQQGSVLGLALSSDGRLLASAGEGHRAVLVWDLGTGEELARLPGHRGDVRCLAFAPDGQTLASTGDDGLILIWDVRAAWQKATAPQLNALPPADLKALWADLAAEDAAVAYRAVCTFAGMPKPGAAYLKEHLRAAVLDPARVQRLLTNLDDDDFLVREAAETELAGLGNLIDDLLRQARKNPPSLEVKTRLARLIQRLEGHRLSVEEIRARRGIEALERIAGPEGKAVLQTLAGGAAESRITQAAQQALDRMNTRRPGNE